MGCEVLTQVVLIDGQPRHRIEGCDDYVPLSRTRRVARPVLDAVRCLLDDEVQVDPAIRIGESTGCAHPLGTAEFG